MKIRHLALLIPVIVTTLALGSATGKDETPSPLKGAVIVVDPGHGGQRYSKSYTGGTRGVVSKLTESELNLRVAFELAKLLKDNGATVYLTREGDHRLSPEGSSNTAELHARVDFFEHYNAHFFLSVHHNAGGASATGHTTLYKHNAKDDTLYEALAQDINDALEGAVPGPKLKLIKGNYHILRETSIPGTISESGFMTNKEFDELSTTPDYPKKEAAAICKGAIKYWSGHKDALIALREQLAKERAEHPRDPKTYTAIDLNPDFQGRMKKLLAQVAPDGKYDPAKIGDYIEGYKKAVVTDPKASFTVAGEFDGKVIKLGGETSDRKYHDQLIDLLVAMKLYNISNNIQLPKAAAAQPKQETKHYLYVVEPGIRNDVQLGGAGILVFDIDNGHKFVKRIETPASREEKPDNIKGVCANAATKRLYFTTTKELFCVDLVTEKTLWQKALPQGCDRMSMTPDGKVLYVPSFEKDIWNVVDGDKGEVLATIETKSGSHNTVVGLDGSRMYLAGLRSPLLSVADTKTHKVDKTIGPFSAPIRPFTVNAAQTLCFVNVNDLLGFEVGDLKTGKKLYRVEITGFEKGPVKRHGCPSHGIGLTPDEKELWVCDGHNSQVHVFDATVMPPKQIASIKLRDQPGWVTFSLDGRYAYPSTGEVIDVKTKKVVVSLTDEKIREVHSEKMVEIHFRDGAPVQAGDQFGVGRATH